MINRNKQRELIRYLINEYGEKNLAEGLGFKGRVAHAWIQRGVVPLKYVYRVADFLNCDPLALNYNDLAFMLNSKKTWKAVVASCHLPKDILENVL